MKFRHYGWFIVAGCTLLLFCTVGLATSAFSVFQPYLIDAGGMSNTQGSTMLTVRSLSAFFSIWFVERALKRTGLRLGVTLAAIGSAASFALFGLAHGFIGYSIAAAVAGAAYGLGGMVPVSILIDRWFVSHKAAALGICAAGTGAATIVAPPLLTIMIRSTSLETAFLWEAAFVMLAAAVVFVLLRNAPEEMGLEPVTGGNMGAARAAGERQEMRHGALPAMLMAMLLLGAIANPGFSHLSVLYQGEGFNAMTVSFLISFVGVTLTAGKCVYGEITDRLGAYRSGYLFFGMLVAGEVLCCFAGSGRMAVAVASMGLLGLGLPLSTVGLSVFAADFSGEQTHAKVLRHFQMAYMAGGLLFGPVPGMLADAEGSYVPAYVVLSVCAAVAMALVQITYKRMRTAHADNSQPDNRPAKGMLLGHSA